MQIDRKEDNIKKIYSCETHINKRLEVNLTEEVKYFHLKEIVRMKKSYPQSVHTVKI